MKKAIIVWTLLLAGDAQAQQVVNGGPVVMGTLKASGAQSGVDFTGAGATAPVKAGLLSARPANCAPGQMYFATDATAGQNLYLCTAAGVWSLGTGGSSGSTGQQSIYSNMYNGGSEYQQPENCLKGIVVPYTAFVSASPFQQVAIATVPGMWSPRVVQVEETSTFASSSGQITTLAASVGTLTNPTYYLQPLAGMQAAPNFKSDNAGGQAAQTTPHTLYLQLAVTNNNPGNLGNGAATNLTAGQLTLRICGVALQ